MTLSAASPTAADTPKGPLARIRSAFRAASARIEARRAYKNLLEAEDYILRDIGVTRAEVRRALLECGGT